MIVGIPNEIHPWNIFLVEELEQMLEQKSFILHAQMSDS